jgi:hypothetical protein
MRAGDDFAGRAVYRRRVLRCPSACHIRAGTGPTPPTSAPGLGPPRPHLRRDCAPWVAALHVRSIDRSASLGGLSHRRTRVGAQGRVRGVRVDGREARVCVEEGRGRGGWQRSLRHAALCSVALRRVVCRGEEARGNRPADRPVMSPREAKPNPGWMSRARARTATVVTRELALAAVDVLLFSAAQGTWLQCCTP